MAAPSASDVLKLLGKLEGLTPDKIRRAEIAAEQVAADEVLPDKALIEPYEPEFVPGMKLTNKWGHTEDIQDIIDALVDDELVWLNGPRGTGKSSLCFHILDRLNASHREKNRKIWQENIQLHKAGKTLKPYMALPYQYDHLSCHDETRVEELTVNVVLDIDEQGNEKPREVYGAVVNAWTQGHILIAEEFDAARPGIWAAAHQFLDRRTQSTDIYALGPKRIHKSPRFRVLATSNSRGKGENQVEYAGTQIQNEAFLSRFTYAVTVDYLPSDVEIKAVLKTGIRQDVVEKMVSIANKIRAEYKAERLDFTMSLRELLSWSRGIQRKANRHGVSDQTAQSMYWQKAVLPAAGPSFLNKIVDPSTQDAVAKFIELH